MDLYSNIHVYLSMCKFSNIENTGKSLCPYIGSSKANRLVLIQVCSFILKSVHGTTTDCAYHWEILSNKFQSKGNLENCHHFAFRNPLIQLCSIENWEDTGLPLYAFLFVIRSIWNCRIHSKCQHYYPSFFCRGKLSVHIFSIVRVVVCWHSLNILLQRAL